MFGYIQGGTLFPEPLTAEEEKDCLEQMAKGNEEARNILIERNLRLVAHICKKYSTAKAEQDDLISIGTIGLIKGINSFDYIDEYDHVTKEYTEKILKNVFKKENMVMYVVKCKQDK